MSDATTPQTEKSGQAGPFLGTLAACIVLAIVIIVLGVKVHHLNAQAADTQAQLTDAKSGSALAQAGLDKAKGQQADLQSRLDKAKSQQADLQSQLDKAKSRQADMQSRLDNAANEAKARSADLQSQLDKAKSQLSDLQAKLNQANDGSSRLQSQLDRAVSQSMDLQSRLQKAEGEVARLQPLALKARHMPVTTSFDRSHWGGSFPMQNSFMLNIVSRSSQPLKVNITIAGPEKTRTQSNVIEVGTTLKVERLAAGDKVVIVSEGFDPVSLTVQ
jgi:predicted nuclease with TOPRIM domain